MCASRVGLRDQSTCGLREVRQGKRTADSSSSRLPRNADPGLLSLSYHSPLLPLLPRRIEVNLKLRENMQTTLGRHAQRSLLEQLASVSAKERADGGGTAAGTADGQFLAHFPAKFPGSGASASAGRKYTALRSSVASKTAKVEALKRRSKQLKALAQIGTALTPLRWMPSSARPPAPCPRHPPVYTLWCTLYRRLLASTTSVSAWISQHLFLRPAAQGGRSLGGCG